MSIRSNRRRSALAAACVAAACLAGAPALVAPLAHGAGHLAAAGPDRIRARSAVRAFDALPLRFEQDPGTGGGAAGAYTARGRGYSLTVGPSGAVLALDAPRVAMAPRARHHLVSRTDPTGLATAATKTDLLRLSFAGASAGARVVGLDPLPGVSNYIVGRDPRRWRGGVRAYARVEVRGVYPGVSIVYYGRGGRLEYDVVLAPGARAADVRLAVAGATRLSLDARGNLSLRTRHGGTLQQARPGIYQQVGGARRAVGGHYVLSGTRGVAFRLGAYDHARALVVDPVLNYSTYMGGSGTDEGDGVAYDALGNTYISGFTSSANFPTTAGAYQAAQGAGVDTAFVAKLSPSGAPVYQTYLGGSGGDQAEAIAVSAGGNAYVTGQTNSTDFPTTTGAYSTTAANRTDAFVSELKPDGSGLVYSTYLGGNGNDLAHGIALDSSGNAYVAGQTTSSDYPTKAAAQAAYGGGTDAFVSELNPAGTALVYSTYLGGSGSDIANAVAVDGAGAAYVAGTTSSTDYPTSSGAFQTANKSTGTGSDTGNGFVTKLAAGGARGYSTLLGGSDNDQINAVTVDPGGDAFVTGLAQSPDFPTTPGAYQATLKGTTNAFVSKLKPDGSGLIYSTYLGGSADDAGNAVAIDPSGDAFVAGETSSTDFPVVNAIQATNNATATNVNNMFISELLPGGGLGVSTYLGGGGNGGLGDTAFAVAVRGATSVCTTGTASSIDFPTMNATQKANNGNDDVIAACLNLSTPAPTSTPPPSATLAPGQPTFTATSTPVPGAPTLTPTRTSTLAPGAPTLAPTQTQTPVPGAPTLTSTPAQTLAPGAPTRTATLVPGAPTRTPTLAPGQPSPTPQPVFGPVIVPRPATVRVGQTVVVSGRGFAGREGVTLALNGAAVDTLPAAIVTGPDGTFTATFAAPSSLLNGANTISAIGTVSRMTVIATVTGVLPVAAQFYFAGAANTPDSRSTLQVLNSTGATARVRVTLYFADGATVPAAFDVAAGSQRAVPVASLTARTGLFGVSVTANQSIAAQLLLSRAGRDGDTLLGNTGLDRRWYLAEGYTGLSFHESIAVLNPDPRGPSHVTLRLLPLGGRPGRTVQVTVPAHAQRVVDVNALVRGLSVSAIATSSDRPVVVERTLFFSPNRGSPGYGTTARSGINVAATTWLFAEGTTVNRFETYLTVLNAAGRAAHVTARFFGRSGAQIGSRTLVVAANSRATIKVNSIVQASGLSSQVTSDVPVVVERPEYFGSPNKAGIAGSDAFGVNGAGLRWSFADGATGKEQEFLLLYNPSSLRVPVSVTFFDANGRRITVKAVIAAHARYTLDVRRMAPRLDGAHGSMVQSLNGQGFVAEQTVFAADHGTLRSTEGFAQ